MRQIIYKLHFNYDNVWLDGIRDDPKYGVSDDVKNWITRTLSNDSKYNGDELNSLCPSGDGCVAIPFRVPLGWCDVCERAIESCRLLPFACPDNIRSLAKHNVLTEQNLEQTLNKIEFALMGDGYNVPIYAGDLFPSFVWQNPLYIKLREIFLARRERITSLAMFDNDNRNRMVEKSCLWSRDTFEALVFNERLNDKFLDSGLPNIKHYSLEIDSRLFANCTDKFYYVESVPNGDWNGDFINEERGWCRCKSCNQLMLCDQQKMIASNKLYSSYRKRNVLPKRYVPDTLWFTSPIYTTGQLNTIMMKREAFDLLNDVDLSFVDVLEVTLIE